MERSNQTHALEYATELGWPVLPVAPGEKKPAGKLVRHGLKDATTDPKTIEGWWKREPTANIGIRCDHFTAIDLDGIEGVRHWNEYSLGDWIETPTARTPSGGRHILVCNDDRLKTTTKVGGRPIDIRAADSYIVVAPSVIGDRHYRWEYSPLAYDIAKAEDFVWELLSGTKKPNTNGTPSPMLIVDGDLDDHPGVGEGERHATACRLIGRYLKEHGVTEDVFRKASAFGQRCTPPMDEKEVQSIVIKLAEKEASKPENKPSSFVTLSFNTIEERAVEWLWQDRLPLGKLVVLCGDPAGGKTTLATYMAAKISTGSTFTDGAKPETGEVLIVTAEDDPADTLKPRLRKFGADMKRVHYFDCTRRSDGSEHLFDFQRNMNDLASWLDNHPDVRLIVFDPISAFYGEDVNAHADADVRRVLRPLSKLAEKYRLTVLAIAHLNKNSGGKSVYRVTGSLAVVAAARVVWRVEMDRDDEGRRLFVCVKSNLSKPTGLAYRIDDDGNLEFENGAVLLSADDIDTSDESSPIEEGMDWLESTLAAGAVEAKKVMATAKADGIADRTLKRAKAKLHVISKRQGDHWIWILPEETETQAEIFEC